MPRVMASENATATGTLDVVCGTLQAKLLTGDLSSGSSLCILLDSKTITPCQFQREAGKAAAKNWKTTIRYRDKPLKHFLENNKYFRIKEENPSLLEKTECGPD